MNRILLLPAILLAYLIVLIPYTGFLKGRPLAVKLGYIPSASVLKTVSGEYKTLMAASAVTRVLFYYGTVVDPKLNIPARTSPEYQNMFKTLETALFLDPYNLDAYYFSQAAFTWELGHAADVNRMLEYGMKYRTWDYMLPFYAGFNAAYFLGDFEKAGQYMKRAAEISGDQLFVNLAARYFYEAGNNELGIVFLNSMVKGTRDKSLRSIYVKRRDALLSVKFLQEAVNRYRLAHGRLPDLLGRLVETGLLKELPVDPYGGRFYLDEQGKVRSTSKFVVGVPVQR